MSSGSRPELDRELARYLMRCSDAIDLIMGGMMEAARGRPASDLVVRALLNAMNEIHEGIRYPILREYPELDLDKKP
jgi:hypothetical protein